ncbi:MAG: four helix bundle protein [Candidatus Colwellbacteria bacterium]|nr:four helix bundle protein [Candidatus Colwellbacteria bacterium]
MASIQKFEDLICWQRARELANFIFDITDRKEFRDFDLKRQMRRAAISPMSNIAEGFDRGTRNEFVDALFIAKGEIGEVRSQLIISFDRRYIDISIYKQGLGLTDECSRLVQSFTDKVKGGARKGIQFKQVKRQNPMEAVIKKYLPEAENRDNA